MTLVFAVRRDMGWRTAAACALVQFVGAMVGVAVAHLMFAEPVMRVAKKLRDGPAQAFSEAIATFGLIFAILGSLRFRAEATPLIVGLYITSAYWFTASTSFANPAVTVARAMSDTFAGIAPASVPQFVVAQCCGTLIAAAMGGWLFRGRMDP